MRSKIGPIIVALLVVSTIGYALVSGGDNMTSNPAQLSTDKRTSSQSIADAQDQDRVSSGTSPDQTRMVTAAGRYTDFTTDRQMERGFDNTVLFFYASWCPECRGFDQAIQSQNIPDGTQILRVDYDNSSQLKQQYGVTIQTTFVRVDSTGRLVKKWVGYGQQKSVDAVLQNVGN